MVIHSCSNQRNVKSFSLALSFLLKPRQGAGLFMNVSALLLVRHRVEICQLF